MSLPDPKDLSEPARMQGNGILDTVPHQDSQEGLYWMKQARKALIGLGMLRHDPRMDDCVFCEDFCCVPGTNLCSRCLWEWECGVF